MAGLACGLDGVSAGHLRGLAHLRLAEDGQQYDTAVRRQPVGDALGAAAEVEAQLADFAAEVAGVGLAERGGVLGEAVDLLLGYHVVVGG